MKKLLPALFSALIASIATPALACGYDSIINNPFTLNYPGSMVVALKTQQAITEGAISPLPALTGKDGLARVSQWLEQLRGRLQQAGLDERFSVYLVDSNLWTRFDPLGGNVLVQSHITPEPNETVLLMTEAGLNALLHANLTLAQAQQKQLFKWSKTNDARVVASFERSISEVAIF
ncbi:hypothetical protein NT239_09175 [Chitinibacter sp. SCUT-21]|uniref:hypothetical protein n=1 Tax=Chitinibacter sp. SCUT-21 TaxID=2970891 RepID=UPI0035A6AA58